MRPSTPWNTFLHRTLMVFAATYLPVRAAEQSESVPYFLELAWTGQAYVGVTTEAIYSSADGVAWTMVHESSALENGLIAVGNDRVVVAGENVLLTASSAGPALKFSESAAPGAKFTRVIFANGQFVAVDTSGRAHVGDGAAAWSVTQIAPGFQATGVAFGNGLWITVGHTSNGSAVFTSKDPARAWKRGTIPSATSPYAVAHGKDGFLIVGQQGLVLTSRDAVTWESATSDVIAEGDEIWGIFAAGDRMFVLGQGLYSPDASGTWTRVDPSPAFVRSPAVRDGELVVVFDDGARRAVLPIDEVMRWTPPPTEGYADAADVEVTSGPIETPVADPVVEAPAIPVQAFDPVGTEVADGGRLFKPNAPEPLRRLVATGGEIVGVTDKGDVVQWTVNHFEPHKQVTGLSSLQDIGIALGDYSRGLPEIQGNPRRVFTGDGRWLLVWPDNTAADTHKPTIYSRYELPKDFEIRDAVRANGTWVIVGRRGDGTGGMIKTRYRRAFSDLERISNPPLNAVTYDGRQFIAVGDEGAVLTSADANTWKPTTMAGAPKLVDIAYGAGKVLALTDAGKVLSSTDGVNWQPTLTDRTEVFRHVAGTPEVLVLASDSAQITWTKPAASGTAIATSGRPEDAVERVSSLTTHYAVPGENLRQIYWDGRQFVGTGDALLYTSHDGRTFAPAHSFQYYLGPTAIFAGQFWAFTEYDLFAAPVGTMQFTSRKSVGQSRLSQMAASNDQLVVLTDDNMLVVSASGQVTVSQAARPALTDLSAFASGNGRWIASGRGAASKRPAFAVSTDLHTWKLIDLPDHRDPIYHLAFGNDRFVGYSGGSSAILSSTDGERWEAQQVADLGWIAQLVFTAGRFYLLAENRLLFSEDGTTWQQLPFAPGLSPGAASAHFGMFYFSGGKLAGEEAREGNLTRVPIPSTTQLAAATRVATTPYAGFAKLFAEWDEKLTNARTETDRLTATGSLLSDWRSWHPGYTSADAFAFIEGMYDRVLGYNVSDSSVWYFPQRLEEFSPAIQQEFLNKQPANVASLWRQINDDIIKSYNQQRPTRVQQKEYTPAPQQRSAQMDIAALRLRAASGQKGAAYDLGYYYRNGTGVPTDTVAAAFWTSRAQAAGLTFVEGEAKTPEEQFASWKHIAEQGSAIAQQLVGEMYRDGKGVTADNQAAVHWFKLAVGGGQWHAYTSLARMYRNAQGVPLDHAAAMRLLEQAAGFGNDTAFAELGLVHEMGAGTPRDLKKAADYFQQAVDRGSFWAMRRLADMYLTGQGVTKDEARARALLQRAADAGDESAKKVIADLTAGKHEPRKLAAYHPPRKLPAMFDVAARLAKAEAGDPGACYDMAYAHWNRYGIEPASANGDQWLAKGKAKGLRHDDKWDTPEAATATWKSLAEQGSVVALEALGERLRDGNGAPVDHAVANELFQRAIAAGNWDAYVEMANQHRNARGTKPDPVAGLRLLEQAAALGYPRAIAEIGWAYEAGCGVKRDLAKAVAYYQKAVDLNFTWAHRRLAEFLRGGHGVARDETKGRALLEKAAELGDGNASAMLTALDEGKHPAYELSSYTRPAPKRPILEVAARRAKAEAGDAAACYDMAYLCWNGYGVDQDSKAGNQWLEKAKAKGWQQPDKWDKPEENTASWKALVDQGSVIAMFEYAGKLRRGEGVAPDANLSVGFYKLAADSGHITAQAEMGLIYEFGRGPIVADHATAFTWYQRAADAGSAFAQMKVGGFYDAGKSVTQDKAAAARYYHLGAEGGNELAALNLAAFLATGTGVPKDERAAARWYLEVAGAPAEPIEPDAAVKVLREVIATGQVEALDPLAIMTKRGFGTPKDVTEAWALAYTSQYFETQVYPFSWFEDKDVNRPVALRRGAKLISDLMNMGILSFATDDEAETRAELAKTFADLARKASSAATSEVAAGLQAIASGNSAPDKIKAAATSPEPLSLVGLAELWETAQQTAADRGGSWLLRLAGVDGDVDDEPEAIDAAFVGALAIPEDEDDPDVLARSDALRRVQVARLFYGIGCEPDRPGALTWALLNEGASDSFSPIHFLATQLNEQEIAVADNRYAQLTGQPSATTATATEGKPANNWLASWVGNVFDPNTASGTVAKVGPVDAKLFGALEGIQNDTSTTTLSEAAIILLLQAVWWDAEYSALEENLARELNDSTARPLVITSDAGHMLTFSKTVDARVAPAFPSYLPAAFHSANGDYYRVIWSEIVNAGVFVAGCRSSEANRTLLRQVLAQNIFQGVQQSVGAAGMSYEQIFTLLKNAHDAANPELRAEFRSEIIAAIELIEAQSYELPEEWKNRAWLREPAAAAAPAP